VQALERLEDVLGACHVEAGAVVAHREHSGVAGLGVSELDARVLRARRVFPRVAQQVVQQALHEPRIGVHRQPRLDAALDALTRKLLVQVLDDRLGQRREVDALVEQLLSRDARERQQAVDDVGRAPHARLDAVDAAANRIVHR
jgi:hypothetical protein